MSDFQIRKMTQHWEIPVGWWAVGANWDGSATFGERQMFRTWQECIAWMDDMIRLERMSS